MSTPNPATTDWVPLWSVGTQAYQSLVPSARVSRSAAQSIASGTGVLLTFDQEQFDTDNIHDLVTNTSRLTCRTAGKYIIGAHFDWQTSTSGTFRNAIIQVNGGTRPADLIQPQSSQGYLRQEPVAIYDLIVGDYIEAVAYHDAASALTVSPTFWMAYIGPGLVGKGVQNLSGTFAARPTAASVPQGTTYFATDTLGTWLSDGTNWLLVQQRTPIITPATMNAAPFTTPYDGQEIVLTDSLTAPTFNWHFRYNASDSTAYKWEFIGGPAYTIEVNPQVIVSSAWPTLGAGSGGPSFDVPRGGNYLCTLGANAVNNATASAPMIALAVQGTLVDQSVCYGAPSAANLSVALSRSVTVSGLAATNTISARYGVLATGAGGFDRRWLTVLPAKVS